MKASGLLRSGCARACRFAVVLVCFGLGLLQQAQAQFPGANPNSGHGLSQCATTNVDGSTKWWRAPAKGQLDLASVLREAATIYIDKNNAIPPNCHQSWASGPYPITSVEDGRVGLSWAGFDVTGDLAHDVSNSCGGGVPSPTATRVTVASCGCTADRNENMVGLGADARCYCRAPYSWSEAKHACALIIDIYQDRPRMCSPHSEHSIYPMTANNRLSEPLGNWLGQQVQVTYDTRAKVPSDDPAAPQTLTPLPSFGPLWHSDWHKRLVVQSHANTAGRAVHVSRGAGGWLSFVQKSDQTYGSDADVSDRLVATADGWRYTDSGIGSIESYDIQGVLQSVALARGGVLTFSYSDASTPVSVAPAAGLLIKVQDHLGRSVQFQYEQPASGQARINRIVDPQGGAVLATYDAAGNLSQLSWPDDTRRQFLYETASLPWALTGIIDENNKRFATYGYDAQGRAVLSEVAGGVDRYTVSYATPPQWAVTEEFDSDGILWRMHRWQPAEGAAMAGPTATASYTSTNVLGFPRVTSQSQPAGAGCAASSNAISYDANGNVASTDDFNGMRTCFVHDASRNLEVARVEGLANTTVCSSVTPQGATLPAGSRKISTQWHPDRRSQTQLAEPGKLSTYVYNGQPDPFNANAIASCAPSTTTLPDGKPIVVLCKKVEQATLDLDGTKAFGLQGTPATAGDPDFAKVSLLLHMDGPAGSAASDNSANPKAVTAAGTAQLSSTQAKFGGSSSAFDGSGDYWSLLHSNEFSIQAGDFTIEAWVYRAVGGQQHYLLSKRSVTVSDGWEWRINADNTLQFFHTGGMQVSSATAVPAGSWVHVAASRNGSTVRLFIAGALVGTATFSDGVENTADTLKIGVGNDLSGGFNGYMDEVRITKGLARYTSAFAVPTAAFGNSTTSTPAIPSSMDTSVPNRVWTYTYNQSGQVLTAKGPRTDVNDTTTYEYYLDTTSDHTVGDLKKVTNAKGQSTQYPLYNKAGQVLRMVDANSVTTDYTYDARQRLKSVNVGGQTTSYDYLPSGQLKRVTQPDASYVEYSYDDAHRQVAVSDNLGNRIDYTLDNAGRKTGETVKDPSGSLSRQVSRIMDALGRVQQVTGRE